MIVLGWEVDKNTLTITETLGEGTFGTVHRATTTEGLKLNNIVHTTLAVKLIKGTCYITKMFNNLGKKNFHWIAFSYYLSNMIFTHGYQNSQLVWSWSVHYI